MAKSDSGFEGLAEAWALTVNARPGSAASVWADSSRPALGCSPALSPCSGIESFTPRNTGRSSVLIATKRGGAPRPSSGSTPGVVAAALALRLGVANGYRIGTIAVSSDLELARLLLAQRPLLLLIDIALVESMGVETMRGVHRALPATYWLVLWDEPSPHGFVMAMGCEAHGGIEWTAINEQFEHAFRTVIGGELWFPRHAMESLYFSQLAAANGLPKPAQAPDVAASATPPLHLTDRETEVLALVHLGLTNQQIADRLLISINTVKKHVAHAFEKRGLHHRRQVLC